MSSLYTASASSHSRAGIWLLAAIAIAACNSDEQVSGIDRGGAPVASAVITTGSVTSFGSVVVNGVRYDTSDAEFIIDSVPGSEADLEIGQVITVRGQIDANDARTAVRVEFDDQLVGQAMNIDSSAGRLEVLGQIVRIDGGTSFDKEFSPRSLEGISSGDVIAISGFLDADGLTVATRIGPDDGNAVARVHGHVSDADTGAMTFRINALTVDYSAAMIENFPGGEPANGDFVEVEGSEISSAELAADRVSLESRNLRDDDDDDLVGEIEGYITRFNSPADFDVDGQPVVTDAQTLFELGVAVDLDLNVKVQAFGSVDAANVLRADVIRFEPPGILAIAAQVEEVNVAAGTITLLGILVRVDELTRLEDQSDDDERIFDLSDMNVGDWLEVHGFEDPVGSNTVSATLLEREDDGDDVELTGFVQSVADPEFSILGVTILTTDVTEFDDISRAEFFSDAVGRLVEVEGQLSGQILVAEEIELEDD